MNSKEEAAYVRGAASAWTQVLQTARREVASYTGSTDADRDSLLAERAETVLLLRSLCDELNSSQGWPDDLYLPDIIEKHLMRPIRAARDL